MKGRILSRIVEGGLLSIILYTPLIHATKGIGTLTATYILILFLSMLWLLRMNPVRGNSTPKGTDAPILSGTSNGVNGQRSFRFINSPLNLPLALFLLFALLSTLFSINRGASLSELYKVLLFILLYFLLINNLKEKYQFRSLLLAILSIGGIVAAYGLYQYFSDWPNLTEIASTFPPNPNSLAGYLLLIIPLAFVYVLFASSRWLSRMGFVISFLTYSCLFTTYSRGGRVALFGSLIFFLTLIFKYLKREEILKARRRFLTLALLLILLSGTLSSLRLIPNPSLAQQIPQVEETNSSPSDILLGEPLTFRSFSFQRTSTNKFIFDRLKIWGRTLEIIRDYPLLGSGMGTYGIIFKRHKIPTPLTPGTIARYGQSARFAHNEYLQIAAETGLPSLVIFLWIITLILRTGLRTLARVSQLPSYPVNQSKTAQPTNWQTGKPENWQNYLTIGLLSGLTGLLLHSLVDFVLRPPATDILFIYFAALIMLQAKGLSKPVTPASPASSADRPAGRRNPLPVPRYTLLHHLYRSPLIRGSLIICVTILLISQVNLPLLAHRHYGKGIGYQKKKAFDQAISSYLIAQKLEPTNDRYHKNLGDLYRHLALVSTEERSFWLEKATEEYEKMVHLSPEDNHYRRDLGIIYWLASQGKDRLLINKAITQFKESLRIDPTFPFSSFALGVIYAKMGWGNRAIKKFEKAVYYEPNYAHAHYNLATLYASQGLFKKAIVEYQEIIKIENKNLFPKVSCGYEKALLSFDYSLAHHGLRSSLKKVAKF